MSTHICKRLQEQVHREKQPNNRVDKYVVAVQKDGKNSWASTIKEKWKICINNFLCPASWSVRNVQYNCD